MPEEQPRTVADAARALRAGTVSSVALTEAALAAADALDARLGVHLARFDARALAAARRADRELATGRDRGPLHGIPLGVKDVLATAEGRTTAQSLVPTGAAVDDAVAVARLRAAGAVITGKTTTMEYGCGMPDPAKPFPVPRNPWNPDRWTGGSSSGTAAGIAAGMFLAGLGSDTAGSIRMPAAFCGVTGLVPTYGLVPRTGCVPLAYSFDRVGPLARTAHDCGLLLDVLAGPDAGDPESAYVRTPPPDTGPPAGLEGLRVGVVREGHAPEGADPAVAGAFDAAVRVLEDLGARTRAVVLPYLTEMITATLVITTSEGLAHHRAGLARRWDDFAAGTRGLLAHGALFSGADYVQAQRARRTAREALRALFRTVDVLVTPTASLGAPRLEELTTPEGHQDNEALFSKVHTPYWNAVGLPVLALPMGLTGEGLPLSLQIAGPPSEDRTVLRVGEAYQGRTSWHRRTPARLHAEEAAR
ncbi:Asp-tRNA(Asn)/Glu-tRNA(Gln) amidotransferase subunit GatA [Streptomyces albiaxialis]|uniref:Asp-tRNA(Asn)/Glu-tRNA(Gln) amidotransferase subunit GatA n=1 Tax=Streptomyces albiaxialis TaxID=329523 RepID=A0ABN2VUL8_9ACTN